MIDNNEKEYRVGRDYSTSIQFLNFLVKDCIKFQWMNEWIDSGSQSLKEIHIDNCKDFI